MEQSRRCRSPFGIVVLALLCCTSLTNAQGNFLRFGEQGFDQGHALPAVANYERARLTERDIIAERDAEAIGEIHAFDGATEDDDQGEAPDIADLGDDSAKPSTFDHNTIPLTFKELIQRKKELFVDLDDTQERITKDIEISEDERENQLEFIRLRRKELDRAQALVLLAYRDFYVAVEEKELSVDLGGLEDLSSHFAKQGLSHLVQLAVEADTDYQNFLKNKKTKENIEIEKQHANAMEAAAGDDTKNMMEDVLHKLKDSADDIEAKMGAGGEAFADFSGKKKAKVVVAMDEDDDEGDGEVNQPPAEEMDGDDPQPANDATDTTPVPKPVKKDHGPGTLIDSENNVYILRKSGDATMHEYDHALLMDVVLIWIASFAMGSAVTLMGLPSFMGYILAGIMLGPTGLRMLKSMVQLETIGQFGVFFILFELGVEFSYEKLLKVLQYALYASGITLVVLTAMVYLGMGSFGVPMRESIFTGMCIFMSSTAVVTKVLNTSELSARFGQITLGVLVLQDVFLGVIIALLPFMVDVSHASGTAVITIIIGVITRFGLFGLCAFVMARYVSHRGLRYLHMFKSTEVLLSGYVGWCVFFAFLSEHLGLSAEVGCFTAGMIISSHKAYVKETLELIDPVSNIFSCVFFACIGSHVYPQFLYDQLPLVIVLTAIMMIVKAVSFSVSLVFLGANTKDAILSSIVLIQISEFAFVLASRAKKLGIINREAYYILLATTALSLMITPFMWFIVRYTCDVMNIKIASDGWELPEKNGHRKNIQSLSIGQDHLA
eukprot:Clim_evm19s47 gene=Clim_evmTU19s47